jgi:hypothetical protein
LPMERTTSFCARSFNGTVSIGGIDQTHRSAAKSKTRKCIIIVLLPCQRAGRPPIARRFGRAREKNQFSAAECSL